MDHPKTYFHAKKLLAPAILLTGLLGGCGSADGEGASFETIARGIDSLLAFARLAAITDEAQWEQFWRAHAGADAEIPAVQFDQEMVIVVHLGNKPTRNAEVQITRIESNSTELVVHYLEVVPSSGCLTRGNFSQPHHIVRTPRTNAQPTFVRSELIHDCL